MSVPPAAPSLAPGMRLSDSPERFTVCQEICVRGSACRQHADTPGRDAQPYPGRPSPGPPEQDLKALPSLAGPSPRRQPHGCARRWRQRMRRTRIDQPPLVYSPSHARDAHCASLCSVCELGDRDKLLPDPRGHCGRLEARGAEGGRLPGGRRPGAGLPGRQQSPSSRAQQGCYEGRGAQEGAPGIGQEVKHSRSGRYPSQAGEPGAWTPAQRT